MGTSHKVILAETLSPTFVGLTFQVILQMMMMIMTIMSFVGLTFQAIPLDDYHNQHDQYDQDLHTLYQYDQPRRWLKSVI